MEHRNKWFRRLRKLNATDAVDGRLTAETITDIRWPVSTHVTLPLIGRAADVACIRRRRYLDAGCSAVSLNELLALLEGVLPRVHP
jgi:hypothetical protein